MESDTEKHDGYNTYRLVLLLSISHFTYKISSLLPIPRYEMPLWAWGLHPVQQCSRCHAVTMMLNENVTQIMCVGVSERMELVSWKCASSCYINWGIVMLGWTHSHGPKMRLHHIWNVMKSEGNSLKQNDNTNWPEEMHEFVVCRFTCCTGYFEGWPNKRTAKRCFIRIGATAIRKKCKEVKTCGFHQNKKIIISQPFIFIYKYQFIASPMG